MNTHVTNNDYKALYEVAHKENELLNFKLQQLQHELLQLKKMIFGSRQEKFVTNVNNPDQLLLDIATDQVTSGITKFRKIEYIRTNIVTAPAIHPGRNKLHEHLRREEIVFEPEHVPEGSKKIGQLETGKHPVDSIYVMIFEIVTFAL
ncbi:hypothetical protein [Chitinophaga sp. S165]|uniref:IS66 family transposase n=1 Tax=Chitinophaga sp. S165 TaxID=2135462 RepID=UPI000D71B55E|nr:hypothetical protein [Chitinophaga sp. S165]PWV48097.1 transposase IS166 family protein [Chitinophaga sp. S165]